VGCGGAGANGGGGEDGESEREDTTAPSAPSGLQGDSENSAVELDWNDVSAGDLDGYRVYRDTESGVGTSGDPLEGSLSETSYSDESVENGTTYFYVVTAVDDASNESNASDEVKVTPFDDPPDRP
jgi:TolB protein